MTTTAAAAPAARASDALAGAGILLGAALRRDRTRLLVWTASIAVLWGYAVVALERIYPTAADRQVRASLMSSPAAVILTGSGFGLDDYTLGAMVANEMTFLVLVALAVLSIQTVVRHTRAEEEQGTAELVRAGAVGRHAPAVTAFALVTLVQLVIAVLTCGVLVATGLDVGGSAVLAAAGAVTGLVFGAVAVVTCQVAEHARTASGLALAALGIAWIVRAAGDLQQIGGSPLSWASPLGWALQTRAFVDTRVWPLGLGLLLTLALLAVGARLGARRDLGAGLVAPRPGPARARASLATPGALAWRLQRGSATAWAVALAAGAVVTGTFADAVGAMIDEMPQLQHVLGGSGELVDAFARLMVLFLAVLVAGFALASFHGVRTEEQHGRLESVLGTSVSRKRWLGARVGVTLGTTAGLLLVVGVGLWVGVASTGSSTTPLGTFVVAALGHLPAIALLVAAAVVCYGWWPTGSGIVWGWFGFSAVAAVYGGLLRLPTWLLDLAPFTHSPALPGAGASWVGAAVMAVLAVGLGVVGVAGFRRRDVPTG